MASMGNLKIAAGLAAAALLANTHAGAQPAAAQRPAARPAVATVPGMPGVPDPNNLYSETVAGKLAPAVAGALERVYVPNRAGNSVSVIDHGQPALTRNQAGWASISRQARAQRRQASAHCWQWSMSCRAHSSPQASQTSAQSRHIAAE